MVEADPSVGKEVFGISHKHPRKFHYLIKGCCCQEICHTGEIVCGFLAFNCARIAYKDWFDGFRDSDFLRRLVSLRTVDVSGSSPIVECQLKSMKYSLSTGCGKYHGRFSAELVFKYKRYISYPALPRNDHCREEGQGL